MSHTCLGCGSSGLQPVVSLGEMPLANALLTEAAVSEPEPRYPLELAFCPVCSLVQITEALDPALLFSEYAYFSSYSETMLRHAESLVERLVEERALGETSLAVEIASNDGYLLQYYARRGVPVLGIDPAQNVAAVANERGIETLCAFFGADLAEELRNAGTRADVLHAHNVAAHVRDVNGLVAGIGRLLADDGIAVIETPYVRDLVERLEFDTIYHEHLFYYSLTSLTTLFARNGVTVVDVERIPIHGGSLRVFAAPAGSAPESSDRVGALLREEQELGLPAFEYYRDFGERVDALRDEVGELLQSLAREGRTLAGYGAAAKGAVLLNSLRTGAELLEFVADRSEYKQGLFMPGVHLPVVSPDRLLESMPDDVLLLAWNFADEILEQQAEYRRRGGRFILPVPSPRVL